MQFTPEQIADLAEGLAEFRRDAPRLRDRFVLEPLQSPRAREHADHGLGRRLAMLSHCVEAVFRVLPPDRDDIPQRDEVLAATASIQSFLMNAFGCCENVAWIWVNEKQPMQPNGRPWRRNQVGILAGQADLRATFSAPFRAYLESRDDWFGHLKDFRDALAHRIPLYIPPFAVDPADADRYQDLEVRAQAALAAGDLVTHEQLSRASRALARFSPVMVHALGETPPVVFHYQLLADASTIIEIGENVLDELAR